MRVKDLLKKLDAVVSEAMSDMDPDGTNKNFQDYRNSDEHIKDQERALQDLQMDPIARKDPAIMKAIMQKRAEITRLKGLK